MLCRIKVTAVFFVRGAPGSASAVTGEPICPACDQDWMKDLGMVGECVEYNVTMLHRLGAGDRAGAMCV